MNVRTRTTLAVFTAFGLAAFPAAHAADGKAEGTLTVNGKTAKLSYAYARAVKGFFDKTKEDVEVVLADVPLEPKALEEVFERIHMADAGQLHALEIILDADAKVISTSFRDKSFKASPSGVSSSDVFEKKAFDGTTVAGRFRSTTPHEFFGDTYSFDVTFDAPIARKAKPAPPSLADAAAAAKSPQAEAYRKYLEALRKEDLPALKKLLSAEMAKNLEGPDAKEGVKLIKMMMASDIRVLKVTSSGGAATLEVTGKQDGKLSAGTVEMVLEGGRWKVGKESWKN
jgi:hypothetical protein